MRCERDGWIENPNCTVLCNCHMDPMNMPAPFDPSDPADALAEGFRRQVTDLMIVAPRDPAYAAVGDPIRQIECFMGGVLTGLIGVMFSHIKPEGRDEMMRAVAAYLPQARQNAEAMVDKATR